MSNEATDEERVVQYSDQPIEVIAEHAGILRLGDYELPCFVLSNKQRVVTQREVIYLLTNNRKGGIERYTNASGVREHMPQKFVDVPHKQVVQTFRVKSLIAYGYEAKDIIDICEGYLKAREVGTLHPSQQHLAAKAEIFIRACARVGLEALIDEATGYQAVRDADELQVKLAAYISQDLNEWTRTFPGEFFKQLYRLEGQPPPVPLRVYPKRFGRYVMNFVYDTLDPDVSDWLRENNPNPHHRKNHHQYLTNEYGRPKLERHLSEVLGIMKVSGTMAIFRENLARVYESVHEKRRQKALEEKRRKAVEKQRIKDDEAGQQMLWSEEELKYI